MDLILNNVILMYYVTRHMQVGMQTFMIENRTNQ